VWTPRAAEIRTIVERKGNNQMTIQCTQMYKSISPRTDQYCSGQPFGWPGVLGNSISTWLITGGGTNLCRCHLYQAEIQRRNEAKRRERRNILSDPILNISTSRMSGIWQSNHKLITCTEVKVIIGITRGHVGEIPNHCMSVIVSRRYHEWLLLGAHHHHCHCDWYHHWQLHWYI